MFLPRYYNDEIILTLKQILHMFFLNYIAWETILLNILQSKAIYLFKHFVSPI